MNLKAGIKKVNERGLLLVFPVNNKKEPRSLWSEFYPRSEMKWEWDQNGDQRVSNLWILRQQLSISEQVIYTKWYRGRATLMSFPVATAMLTIFKSAADPYRHLGHNAREMLDLLNDDSPLSTKQLKTATELKGRSLERIFTNSLKELWTRLLIVGFGEVDDGAFPSLAVGSTKVIFESLWRDSLKMKESKAWNILEEAAPQGSLFRKYFNEVYGHLLKADEELDEEVNEELDE